MDGLLIALAVLGLVTILLAVYILSVATPMYTEQDNPRVSVGELSERRMQPRSAIDRRRGGLVTFPLVIDGELVEYDRRKGADRRSVERQSVCS